MNNKNINGYSFANRVGITGSILNLIFNFFALGIPHYSNWQMASLNLLVAALSSYAIIFLSVAAVIWATTTTFVFGGKRR